MVNDSPDEQYLVGPPGVSGLYGLDVGSPTFFL